MTKKELSGLTIAQLKTQYPKGAYKSGMSKAEVIDAAHATIPKAKARASRGSHNER